MITQDYSLIPLWYLKSTQWFLNDISRFLNDICRWEPTSGPHWGRGGKVRSFTRRSSSHRDLDLSCIRKPPSCMSLSYHLFFVILVLAVVAFLPTKRHFNIQTVRGSGTLFHWGPHNFNNVLLLSRFHCCATMKASYPKFILVCNLRFTLIAPITPPDYQWLSPDHKIIIGQSSAISSPYLVHLVTVWKLHCNKCSIHQSQHDSLLVSDVSIFCLSVINDFLWGWLWY